MVGKPVQSRSPRDAGAGRAQRCVLKPHEFWWRSRVREECRSGPRSRGDPAGEKSWSAGTDVPATAIGIQPCNRERRPRRERLASRRMRPQAPRSMTAENGASATMRSPFGVLAHGRSTGGHKINQANGIDRACGGAAVELRRPAAPQRDAYRAAPHAPSGFGRRKSLRSATPLNHARAVADEPNRPFGRRFRHTINSTSIEPTDRGSPRVWP